MANELTGLAAALAQHMPEKVIEEPEQLELDPVAALPLFEPIKGQTVATGGRPKGALNKSTRDLAEYVLRVHRHPVIAAAQICDMPLVELCRQLVCERLEAAKYQQQCREFVAKYTLQAMPQLVQFDAGTVGGLMVINLNAPRPGEQADASPFALDITPIEQKQGVSNDAAQSPHEQSPHNQQTGNGNNDLSQ
jgi:hypothetical protein